MGDIIVLPLLVVMPVDDDSRVVLQPLATSSFTVQIPDISRGTAVSFALQTSDPSVAVAATRSPKTLAGDFSFDVQWIGAGACVVTVVAACNCSANASSALLFVQSLPLVVAVPNALDVINPQMNVSMNITLPQPVDRIVVINLRPNVPLAFVISPATITITPAALFETVTISYGSPGRYSVLASSPFPGPLSGLLMPVASVVVRPLLLADQFNVVVPHQGTHVMKFQQLPVPIDAPINITIFPSSSSSSTAPPISLNSTNFAMSPASSSDALCVSIRSIVDFWAGGSVVSIRFSIAAPPSSIYFGAHGVAAVVHLLPRIAFPALVYVPLFRRSVIAITAIRSTLQADIMGVSIEGGGADVIMSQSFNVTSDADGSTVFIPIRCAPDSAVTRSLYVLFSGGSLDGAAVGPVAVVCMRRSITAEPSGLSVAQQGTATFYLRCDVPPDTDVTLALRLSRDGCASLDKSSVHIPARTEPSTAFAVTVTHLQPCAVTVQMQIFSFYGNYAPDGSPDAPQPFALVLSGSVAVVPSHLSLSRGSAASLSLSLNPPADAPLLISFRIGNSSVAGANLSACAVLDPPFFVVAREQGGPFAFVARHNAVGACSVDVIIAVRSSNSIYSGFLRTDAFSLVALSYVEVNGGEPLRVRGGGRGAQFSVRILTMPSAFGAPQIFNVSFAAGKGLSLAPSYMILSSASTLDSAPSLLVAVALDPDSEGSIASSDEFSFRVEVACIGVCDAPASSIFTVHRLPSVLLPPSPVLLPVGASYTLPIQLGRPSASSVLITASLSSAIGGSNSSSACPGVQFSRFSVFFDANSVTPSSPMVVYVSLSRNVSCFISWSVASADALYSSAVLPELALHTLLPLNASSTAVMVPRGGRAHFAIACPAHTSQTCTIALEASASPIISSPAISAELQPISSSHVYDDDSMWGSGGAALVVAASQHAVAGEVAVFCCKAAAAAAGSASPSSWSHGVCVRVLVAPVIRVTGGGSCPLGDSIVLSVLSEGQPALGSRVEYFAAGQQSSGVRIEVNGSAGHVTCLSQGSYFIQACVYPIPEAPAVAVCSGTPAPVTCTPRPLLQPFSPMFPSNIGIGTSSTSVSASFSPRSLVVLLGSSASAFLSVGLLASPPSLSFVATSAHVTVRAASAAPGAQDALIPVNVACLDVAGPGTVLVRAVYMGSSAPAVVLDEMRVSCSLSKKLFFRTDIDSFFRSRACLLQSSDRCRLRPAFPSLSPRLFSPPFPCLLTPLTFPMHPPLCPLPRLSQPRAHRATHGVVAAHGPPRC